MCASSLGMLLESFAAAVPNHFVSFKTLAEMAQLGALVCLIIVAMDIVAGTFGIMAQISANKVTHLRLRDSHGCQEPRYEAFKLGLAAAALQAVAHIVANLLGGCICVRYTEELERSSANRQLWFACLILSWIVEVVGFPMLIIGMLENSKSKGSCVIFHNKYLLIGGILCFVHGFFCIALYASVALSFGHQRSHR